MLECANKFKSQKKAAVLSGVKGDEQYKVRRSGAGSAFQDCGVSRCRCFNAAGSAQPGAACRTALPQRPPLGTQPFRRIGFSRARAIHCSPTSSGISLASNAVPALQKGDMAMDESYVSSFGEPGC